MTEIKRFDMRGNTWPSDDGSIVSYKDHAAIVAGKDAHIASLQEQVRVLAAECKAVYSHALEEGYQFYPGGIEYTDAVLREIRADGAMACGTHLREWYDYQVEERAEEFAAAILAGEQP